jgi:hypothetical protein
MIDACRFQDEPSAHFHRTAIQNVKTVNESQTNAMDALSQEFDATCNALATLGSSPIN